MPFASKQLRFKRVVFFIHLLLKNCLTTIALEIGALASNAILILKKTLGGRTSGASVFKIFYFVDSDKPVLGGVSFFQHIKFEFLSEKNIKLVSKY